MAGWQVQVQVQPSVRRSSKIQAAEPTMAVEWHFRPTNFQWQLQEEKRRESVPFGRFERFYKLVIDFFQARKVIEERKIGASFRFQDSCFLCSLGSAQPINQG
ncbi:hypothetical protein AAC387_Pa07g3190 [Persea americana]